LGAGEVAGCFDDALQGAAQVEVGADADDGVEQGAKSFVAGRRVTPDRRCCGSRG